VYLGHFIAIFNSECTETVWLVPKPPAGFKGMDSGKGKGEERKGEREDGGWTPHFLKRGCAPGLFVFIHSVISWQINIPLNCRTRTVLMSVSFSVN